MFQLTKDEFENMRSQFVTSNWGGLRYLPYAFTEHGVAMLASVFKSEPAIQINILIVRAFVAIRQTLGSAPSNGTGRLQDDIQELRQYVEDMFSDQNDINEDTRMQLELINQTLAEMQAGKQTDNAPRRRVGFIQENG